MVGVCEFAYVCTLLRVYAFDTIHICACTLSINKEEFRYRNEIKASNGEKVCLPGVGGAGGYTMSSLSQTQEAAVFVIKLYLHIFIFDNFGLNNIYKNTNLMEHTATLFGINSWKCFIFKKRVWFCLFYVCLEAMAFKHKGIKEIQLIQFENEVTEGYPSGWHVQWTEKQISMSISKLKSRVLVFLYISATGDVADEKENWIASEIAFYMGSVRNKCGGA